jgi:hypothetical protein
MCDEHADHWAEAEHRASRRYRCSECCRPIRAGERYRRIVLFYDGGCTVWRLHQRCAGLMVELDEYGCMATTLDGLNREQRVIWRRSIRSAESLETVSGRVKEVD